jgi:hypothetical protein
MTFDVLIVVLIPWDSFRKFSVERKDTNSSALSFNFEEVVRRWKRVKTAGSM